MPVRDRKIVAISWLTMLKHVTRQTSDPITKDKLAAYAALLCDEFGPEAFTKTSLELVSNASEFFPAYKAMRDLLVQYQASLAPQISFEELSPDFRAWSDSQENNQAHKERMSERDRRCREDWSDPHKILESAGKVKTAFPADHPMRVYLGKILGNAVRANAPENVGYLPPEWQGEVT